MVFTRAIRSYLDTLVFMASTHLVRNGLWATAALGILGVAGTSVYAGLITGILSPDFRIGRRMRTLGPFSIEIAADRETVYGVIAQPYAERTTRALQEKVKVLDRSPEMVLAAHYTPLRGRLKATTIETVRFERPARVYFRLVRGPVPHVAEMFELITHGDGTRLTYSGELGTDLWGAGAWWGDVVAQSWELTVRKSFTAIKIEAERLKKANSRRVAADLRGGPSGG